MPQTARSGPARRLLRAARCEVGAEEVYKHFVDAAERWERRAKASGAAAEMPALDVLLKDCFDASINPNWAAYAPAFAAEVLAPTALI
jgi:hypothetical protein